MNKDQSKKLTVKVLIGMFIIFATFQVFSYARQVYKDYQTDLHIQELKNNNSDLEKENKELEEILLYFETDAYKEKKAKEILNLKNMHESVVVFKDNQDIRNEYIYDQRIPKKLQGEKNPVLWWHYFFGMKN